MSSTDVARTKAGTTTPKVRARPRPRPVIRPLPPPDDLTPIDLRGPLPVEAGGAQPVQDMTVVPTEFAPTPTNDAPVDQTTNQSVKEQAVGQEPREDTGAVLATTALGIDSASDLESGAQAPPTMQQTSGPRVETKKPTEILGFSMSELGGKDVPTGKEIDVEAGQRKSVGTAKKQGKVAVTRATLDTVNGSGRQTWRKAAEAAVAAGPRRSSRSLGSKR